MKTLRVSRGPNIKRFAAVAALLTLIALGYPGAAADAGAELEAAQPNILINPRHHSSLNGTACGCPTAPTSGTTSPKGSRVSTTDRTTPGSSTTDTGTGYPNNEPSDEADLDLRLHEYSSCVGSGCP